MQIKFAKLPMNNWDDIQHFLAIVRTGSLQAASDSLGVDKSTVFRRLRSLEDFLGTQVFDRRHRGRYELTRAGQKLVQQGQKIESAMHDIEHQVRGTDRELSGSIRVATAEDIAVTLLPPHLRNFEQQYPEITIELLTSNRYYSLARGEADVAIRPGFSTEEERVIPQRICLTRMGLYASQSYLQQYGYPENREQLKKHRLIEWRQELSRDGLFTEIARLFNTDKQFGSNSLLTISAMSLHGLGIALLPDFVGDATNGLRQVLPDWKIQEDNIWLLHHNETRHQARIRVFNEFIIDALRGDERLTGSKQRS